MLKNIFGIVQRPIIKKKKKLLVYSIRLSGKKVKVLDNSLLRLSNKILLY